MRWAFWARSNRSSNRPSPSDLDRGMRIAAPCSPRYSIREATVANWPAGSESTHCSTSGSSSMDQSDITNDVTPQGWKQVDQPGGGSALAVRCAPDVEDK